MMDEPILVLSTCQDINQANDMATALVDESLAACVNLVSGVQSVYRWQGAVQSDSECLMVIKTKQSMYQQLESRLKQLHPYELPEIISVTITNGFKPYLDWIGQSTGQHNENNH